MRSSLRVSMSCAALAACAVVAACSPSEPETRKPPQPPSHAPARCEPQSFTAPPRSRDGFDGASALAWADAIVNVGGGLRPRTPTSTCHDATADWLEKALAHPGWTVHRQSFTGTDYASLPKGSAEYFVNSCNPADRAEVPAMRFINLWALRRGVVTDRTLVLGAHWDAKEDATEGGVVPAANDGASGMAILLELQRVLDKNAIELPFNLVIAFFDGEDGFNDCHPLAGSLYFARHMPVAVDRMLLLDMVGDRDARFLHEQSSVDSDPDLVKLIWSKAKAHGLGQNFTTYQSDIVDDHRPFIDVGVPAVDIIDHARKTSHRFPPYWHTRADTVDKLSANMLGSMGELLLDVLQDPSFVALWPPAK